MAVTSLERRGSVAGHRVESRASPALTPSLVNSAHVHHPLPGAILRGRARAIAGLLGRGRQSTPPCAAACRLPAPTVTSYSLLSVVCGRRLAAKLPLYLFLSVIWFHLPCSVCFTLLAKKRFVFFARPTHVMSYPVHLCSRAIVRLQTASQNGALSQHLSDLSLSYPEHT